MDEQDSNSGRFGCWRRLADADRTHGPFTDGSSLTQAGDQLWQVFSAHACRHETFMMCDHDPGSRWTADI